MKITVNQLRRIIKEEVGRIFEGEDTAARAERLRKAGSSGLDHPDFKNLSPEDKKEYYKIFNNSNMANLPAMLKAALENAENNLDGDSPKEAVEMIKLLNQLNVLFKKMGM